MLEPQMPPTDESTLSSSAAAKRLGCYASQVQHWVKENLLAGGYYLREGKVFATWWVVRADVVRLVAEGGPREGIRKRKLAQRERLLKEMAKS